MDRCEVYTEDKKQCKRRGTSWGDDTLRCWQHAVVAYYKGEIKRRPRMRRAGSGSR